MKSLHCHVLETSYQLINYFMLGRIPLRFLKKIYDVLQPLPAIVGISFDKDSRYKQLYRMSVLYWF